MTLVCPLASGTNQLAHPEIARACGTPNSEHWQVRFCYGLSQVNSQLRPATGLLRSDAVNALSIHCYEVPGRGNLRGTRRVELYWPCKSLDTDIVFGRFSCHCVKLILDYTNFWFKGGFVRA